VIHYHGTPITPRSKLLELAGRCFCVSFAHPQDVQACHQIGQAVMLDNGAFTLWRTGRPTNWPAYYRWCERWLEYRTTWAVIPDVIDGTERENDRLLAAWPFRDRGAPVWHLHERLDRLVRLAQEWPRVCLGSSGSYRSVGGPPWRQAHGRSDGPPLPGRAGARMAAHAPRHEARRRPVPVRLGRQHERRAQPRGRPEPRRAAPEPANDGRRARPAPVPGTLAHTPPTRCRSMSAFSAPARQKRAPGLSTRCARPYICQDLEITAQICSDRGQRCTTLAGHGKQRQRRPLFGRSLAQATGADRTSIDTAGT
jgi:hypothetical protein